MAKIERTWNGLNALDAATLEQELCRFQLRHQEYRCRLDDQKRLSTVPCKGSWEMLGRVLSRAAERAKQLGLTGQELAKICCGGDVNKLRYWMSGECRGNNGDWVEKFIIALSYIFTGPKVAADGSDTHPDSHLVIACRDRVIAFFKREYDAERAELRIFSQARSFHSTPYSRIEFSLWLHWVTRQSVLCKTSSRIVLAGTGVPFLHRPQTQDKHRAIADALLEAQQSEFVDVQFVYPLGDTIARHSVDELNAYAVTKGCLRPFNVIEATANTLQHMLTPIVQFVYTCIPSSGHTPTTSEALWIVRNDSAEPLTLPSADVEIFRDWYEGEKKHQQSLKTNVLSHILDAFGETHQKSDAVSSAKAKR